MYKIWELCILYTLGPRTQSYNTKLYKFGIPLSLVLKLVSHYIIYKWKILMHSESTTFKSINKIRTIQSPCSSSNTTFIYITLFGAQDIAHLPIHKHIAWIPETINITWKFGSIKTHDSMLNLTQLTDDLGIILCILQVDESLVWLLCSYDFSSSLVYILARSSASLMMMSMSFLSPFRHMPG